MIENAHQAVLLNEVVEQLDIQADGIYIDATFGRGGHSKAILEHLGGTGMLIAIDQDPDAIASGQALAAAYPQLRLVHDSFANLIPIAKAQQCLGKVCGIFADLGVSSPQLDVAHRGFSFRQTGPLDMRMNPQCGEPVSVWIAEASEQDLADVFYTYGEERYSRRVARAIVARRAEKPFETTTDLAEVIASAIPKFEPGKHKATRCFQALRIFVNKELEVLQTFLSASKEVLTKGGKLLAISFHSLEDRIVKRFMKEAAKGNSLPSYIPLRFDQLESPSMRLCAKAIKPSQEELTNNPRSRSAVLRVAEKLL